MELTSTGAKGPVISLACDHGRLAWSAGACVFIASTKDKSPPHRLLCPSHVRSLTTGLLDTGLLELIPQRRSPSPVLALGCENGTIRLHSLETGRCVYPMNNVEKSPVVGLSLVDNNLLSLTAAGRLCLRSLGHYGTVLAELRLPESAFQLHCPPKSQRLIACSPEQVYLISFTSTSLHLDSVLRLETGRELRRAELSWDGSLLALLYEEGTLELRCLLTRRVVSSIRLPNTRLRHFAFSPFGDALTTHSESGSVNLHTLDGEVVWSSQLSDSEEASCLAASSNSRVIGLRDGRVLCWDQRNSAPSLLFLTALSTRALGVSPMAQLPKPLSRRLLFGLDVEATR